MKRLLNPKHQAKRVINKTRRVQKGVKKQLSVAKDYTFSIDNPRKKTVNEKELTVDGWIISKKGKHFKLRIRNNEKIISIQTGIKRLDVAKTHPDVDKDKALYSGFKAEFDFEDGDIVIEIDQGRGYKKLYKTTVAYGTENLPANLYNKDLSDNYPEHLNLLENRQKYYYENQIKPSFDWHEKDARLIAIYLPQFHPFKENDEAWGKGFTEWTNVTTGHPRFIGQQQPILPKDLGFYDLRLESKMLEQIELAKKYGIHGFCFYYYWFSGHKLMDKPIENFLKHKEWDFNFTICWANENWTKRWDGRDSEVIIAQEYLEDDPINFIKDVEHILTDKRYICEDGKPVLTVYRASELKYPERYAKVWREYFRDKYDKELHLVSYLSFDDQDPRSYGFDAALDFAPLSAFFKNQLFEENTFPYIDVGQKLLDVNFSGVVADYRSIALNDKLHKVYDFPVYQCITPSWDNEARKKGNGFVYQNSSPDLYAQWLDRLVEQEIEKKDSPLIFVNAWNEWAEGAMMEPSIHLGHAVLNRTAETLAAHSVDKNNLKKIPKYGLTKKTKTKLAIVIHLYYVELWPEIKKRLENINVEFDLFVTLSEKDKYFEINTNRENTTIHKYVLPNRGRDVLPFLYVARRIKAAGYEHVLKIHSKKSKHRNDGSSWFGDILSNLLPNESVVNEIIDLLKHTDTGIIGPENHLVSLKRHMGSNREILEHLLKRAYGKEKAKKVIESPEYYTYFGGTMFWARVDVLDKIIGLQLMPDDFQSEHGQIDGTTAHAIERLFGVVSILEKRTQYVSSKDRLEIVAKKSYTSKYKFAP